MTFMKTLYIPEPKQRLNGDRSMSRYPAPSYAGIRCSPGFLWVL